MTIAVTNNDGVKTLLFEANVGINLDMNFGEASAAVWQMLERSQVSEPAGLTR